MYRRSNTWSCICCFGKIESSTKIGILRGSSATSGRSEACCSLSKYSDGKLALIIFCSSTLTHIVSLLATYKTRLQIGHFPAVEFKLSERERCSQRQFLQKECPHGVVTGAYNRLRHRTQSKSDASILRVYKKNLLGLASESRNRKRGQRGRLKEFLVSKLLALMYV
jgi:hypothetical protein